MIVDDYGQEWERSLVFGDSADMISRIGLRAFLVNVREYLEDDELEAENIQKVLEQW
jgi:hypothetical protein